MSNVVWRNNRTAPHEEEITLVRTAIGGGYSMQHKQFGIVCMFDFTREELEDLARHILELED